MYSLKCSLRGSKREIMKYILLDLMSLVFILITLGMMVHQSYQKTINQQPLRPNRCIGSADLLYRYCCTVPPFFTRATSRECGGGQKILHKENAITVFQRHSYDCSYWYCVLNKYELITPSDYVDHEKYFAHLDLWVALNPGFSNHILDAKVNCKEALRFYLPLKPCEFSSLNLCIRNYLKVKCPSPIDTEPCAEQKRFFDNCGDYFVRKK